MSAKPRILLSTVYTRCPNDYYCWFAANARTPYRLVIVRYTSFGLRFIKQNFPQIEIMEYPTWRLYTKKIQEGWERYGAAT